MDFTLKRKRDDQMATINVLRELYEALSKEEQKMVNPSREKHLLFMFALLFKRLGTELPHGAAPPKNQLEISFLYSEIREAAQRLGFVVFDFNTSKVFSQQGDKSFVAFSKELLDRLSRA